MTSEKLFHLSDWEECLGVCSKVIAEDGILIAQVGKIHLALPLSLEQSLRPLIGQSIAILRTDIPGKTYLYRVLVEKSNSEKIEEQRGNES